MILTPQLKEFILHYCTPTDEELTALADGFAMRTVKKNSHMLKPGQVCGELVFVANGLFRQYYKDRRGKEITTWISFENSLSSEISSFVTQKPSHHYIQALEESEVACISHATLQSYYQTIGAAEQFGRKIAEKIAVGAINRVVSLQQETAEQRYDRLLQRPEYFQRVPLKYLASFIGITDTSLSRLRRRKSGHPHL